MTAKHPHEDKRRTRRLARALKGWNPSPAPIGYAPSVAAYMAAAAAPGRPQR